MRPFPLFAHLKDRPCLLVGGGEIAGRKSRQLLAAGADLTVVAPELGTELARAVADGRVTHIAARFAADQIGAHVLIVAATPDRAVNQAVSAAAEAAGRLCNVVDDAELCSFIMPAVVERGPVLIAVSTGGASPVLARLLRERLEDWLPERIGELARWSRGWRDRIKTGIEDFPARLRFWQRALDGPIADAVLNGLMARADQMMETELASGGDADVAGIGWLVGAGPGDPGLLTRRATDCLRRADVILHDRLVASDIVALARRDARLIPVGKTPDGPSTPQQEINALLVDLVGQGLRVCRLKGGDPFIFGRGGEEAEALQQAGLAFAVVPGITAALGCAASAAIPLTHRDAASAVTFVTGHDAGTDGTDWAALAASRQTLAIYMGVRRLPDICTALREHGRPADTPAAIVENGSTPRQRIIRGTLGSLPERAAEASVRAPALLIVGDVVRLAGRLQPLRAPENGLRARAPGHQFTHSVDRGLTVEPTSTRRFGVRARAPGH